MSEKLRIEVRKAKIFGDAALFPVEDRALPDFGSFGSVVVSEDVQQQLRAIFRDGHDGEAFDGYAAVADIKLKVDPSSGDAVVTELLTPGNVSFQALPAPLERDMVPA